ncbi:MAG TPA: hypothetical protein VFQ23_13920 [Anaerolineales bacterium]|nr:hypothetical protein [Anaerolineales bacterium]
MNQLLRSYMTQTAAHQVITLTAGDLFPGYNGCVAILHVPDQELEVVACWRAETRSIQ